MAVTILLWVLAVSLVILGMAGLALPALPGAPLLFLGLVVAAWAENFEYVGTWTLVILAILAALTYAIDIIAGAFGAKKFGASGRAMLGAGIGAIVGIFFGLVGVLLGPFIGAVIGELANRNNIVAAGQAGAGATIGLVLGAAGKLALAFVMLALFALVRFF